MTSSASRRWRAPRPATTTLRARPRRWGARCVGTRSDSLQRYVTASGSGVSASGRVDFWGIGLVAGRLAWLGSAMSNGPDSMNVMAVDQRTGRVTAAGSTWAYGC